MSDIEFRVDQAFSSAVQQQLDEQREIRKLVSRVDETLIALSDGLGDLSGQLDNSVQQMAVATPADIEQARGEIIEHVSRVAAALESVEEAATRPESVERLDSQVSALSREVGATREALLDALDRLREDTSPATEGIERARGEILDALQAIPAAVRSHEDEAWQQAVQRLDDVISRATTIADEDRHAFAEVLDTWKADAAEAVKGLADRRAERDTTVVEALDVLRDQVTSNATRGESADQLLLERVTTATSDLASDVVQRHDDMLGRLTQVVRIAEAVAPDTRAVLDDIAARLAQMVQQTHDDALDAVKTLGAARGATPQEVQGIVTQLVDHMDTRVNTALADVLDRNATAADAVSRAADVLQRRADSAGEQLDQIGDRLLARIGETGAHQAGVVEEGVERAVTTLLEQQTATSRSVREAADALLATAGELQPQLATSLEQLRQTLAEQSGADREEVEQAFESLKAASTEARDGVLGAVGRATTRLAEVQSEGISRLTAVADELGRVPETVSPAVLGAVEDMHAGVADAIRMLREQSEEASSQATAMIAAALEDARATLQQQTAAASGDAVTSWHQLTDVQQAHAQKMAQATEALTRLADELEPSIRSAMGETSTSVRQHIDGASTSMQEAARDAGAVLRQDAVDVGAGLRQDATDLGAELRKAAEDASEMLTRAATQAAAQLETSQQDGLTALGQASGRVHEAGVEVATVMGSTRAGLVGAVKEARAEVAALLDRTDEATRQAIADSVADASQQWLAQVNAQGIALSDRTQEILQATSGISPAVDDLVARLKGEVASVASHVLSDVQGSVAETNRLVEALEPALEQMVQDLRQSMQAEMLQATTAAASETDRIVRAADVVEQQTTEQVTRLVSAADSLARTSGEVQPHISEQLEHLRSAVTETGLVVDNRLSTIVEATDAQLQAAREAGDEQVAKLTDGTAAQIASITRATGEQVTDLTEQTAAHLAQIREAGEAHIRNVREQASAQLVETQHAMSTHLDHVLGRTAAQLEEVRGQTASQLEEVREQTTSQLQEVRGQTAAQLEEVREQTSAQLSSTTGALAAHRTALSDSTQSLTEALDTNLATTRDTLSETVEALVTSLTMSIEAQAQVLQGALAETTSKTRGAAEEIGQTSETVRDAVIAAVGAITDDLRRESTTMQTQLVGAFEGLLEQFSLINQQGTAAVAAASEEAISRAVSANEVLRDEVGQQLTVVAEQLSDASEQAGQASARAEHASAQANRTSEDLVGIGGQVVASVESAVNDLGDQMTAAQDGLRRALEHEMTRVVTHVTDQVDAAVQAASESLTQRSADIQARLSQLEGAEAEIVTQLDGLIADVTGKLTGELVMTREIIREAAASRSQDSEHGMATLLARIDAFGARVEATVSEAVTKAAADEREGQLSQIDEVVRAAVAAASARDSGAEQQRLEDAARRLDQLGDRMADQDDQRATDLQRLQAALADMHGDLRADGDALLDAVAGRVDQMLAQMASAPPPPPPPRDPAADELARTAEMVRDAVGQLEALGSQLEHQVQRVEGLDVRVDEALRSGIDEMRASRPAPSAGATAAARRTAPSRPAPGGPTAPMPPPSPKRGDEVVVTAVGSTTCPDCGFVTRTRQGLMAHRKTCDART